jgi:3-phenylpropionate/trans-cinnamate dioxygenase ferredoxin reductase subunit
MKRHVVIVGGGQAGGRFAEALRKGGSDARITLLAEEPQAPYERPPLSKGVLAGKDSPESTRLPVDWAGLGIDLLTATRAAAIDRAGHRLHIAGAAAPLDYTTLVLATGARARLLPALADPALPVFALRSLADAAALRAAIRPGARVLLVGGGVIGLEVAATATALGAHPVVVEFAPRLMGRSAPAFFGDRLLALARARGVGIRLGTGVIAAERLGEGVVATLGDGSRIEADLVVLGIGAAPDEALAAAAGLATRDGILVDGHARSSDPDILAIGDVARHPLPRFGAAIRQESWRHAEAHARAAAAALLDPALPDYDDVPGFWSDQHGQRLLVEGLPDRGTEVLRGDPAAANPVGFYLAADGRLVGAATLGDSRAMAVARRLIAAGARPDPAKLADPGTDLRALLKA